MLVSCIQTTNEIGTSCADVIVFPEYSQLSEMTKAHLLCPDSIVVGATLEQDRTCSGPVNRGRAILFAGDGNEIDYLKSKSDSGGTTGISKRPDPLPIYESDSVCIGVLICVDVEEGFSRDVIEAVRSSRKPMKIVCILAAMTASVWNWSNPLPSNYHGVHIVLCNNYAKAYPPPYKSFIAAPNGTRLTEERPNVWRLSTPLNL